MAIVIDKGEVSQTNHEYESGAVMGMRFGISFALRQIQVVFKEFNVDESVFDYLMAFVWNTYLENPQIINEEIQRHKEFRSQTSFLDDILKEPEDDQGILAQQI